MEQFNCRYCGAAFGIAGPLDTDEDWAAQDGFDEQVRHHASRMCRHGRTPQSVLDAPQHTPVTISRQIGFSRSERRHGVYYPPKMTTEARTAAHGEAVGAGRNVPAPTSKVRKVRRGRMARFNGGAA